MERLIGKVTEADFVKITKRYLVQPTTGDNLDCDEEVKPRRGVAAGAPTLSCVSHYRIKSCLLSLVF